MSQSPSPEEELAKAQERSVWGTFSVHMRNGKVTHTVLRETVQPSGNPLLAAKIQQQSSAKEALESGEDSELVYARIRNGQLTLIAIERHRICTLNNSQNRKDH